MTKQNEFKLGDIVEVIGTVFDNNRIQIGMRARVIDLERCFGSDVGLEFFEDVHGHSMDGTTKSGYGWYVRKSVLKVVSESADESPEKITVYLEGTRTTVVLEDGSTGTASLMHGDTYSVEKGIEIAKAKALIDRKTKRLDELREKANKLSTQIIAIQREYQETVKPIQSIEDEILELEEKVVEIGG